MSAVGESPPSTGHGRRAEVAARLARSLPPASLLVEGEALKPYECDGLSAYRETPLAVAIPTDERQVADVLRAALESKTPVVARGSGTGLSGGALPLADGILLSMRSSTASSTSIRRRAARACSRASPTCASRSTWPPSVSNTRPIRRARSRAPSAGTSPRTRAACTA
jgi:hypothetical protein